MAQQIIQISGSIAVNSTQACKAIDDLDKKANSSKFTLEKLGKGVENLGSFFTKTFTTAAVAVGGYGIKLASDLTEVQNVVDTVFGDGAEKVNAWSKAAKGAFGMSELQAKKYNGALGAVLKSSGITTDKTYELSTGLTGLIGDFASFYNLEHEETFNKIKAGITGETEPLILAA